MDGQILKGLSLFQRSSLEDLKRVSFLNRFDTKFVLWADSVPDFLEHIRDDYSALEINGLVAQTYETVYFDTPELLCFNMHHNKRARRFKFRTRKYMNSGDIFNEIKQKLNTGKTVKFRQRRDGRKGDLPVLANLAEFDGSFASLLLNNGYNTDGLRPSLFVYFDRTTFLNKNFPERMTLDLGLRYMFNGVVFALNDTAIVELKREKGPERTVSQRYFRSINKNPSGFSKYTIGISLTHERAKKNRFLPRLRSLAYERKAA